MHVVYMSALGEPLLLQASARVILLLHTTILVVRAPHALITLHVPNANDDKLTHIACMSQLHVQL